MEKLGFNSNFMKWTSSYFFNRRQYVKFGSKNSKMFIATSGIGQGTHLGPPLFVVMINDLIEFVQAQNDLLFADDNKLFARISNIIGCKRLQKNLESVNSWCNLNRMFLNVKKCEVMTITRKMSDVILYPYHINNIELKRVSSRMDLGVYFNLKMDFIEHMDQKIAKSYGMLGFLIRCSKEFKDPYVMKTLYCSFVRPILEYASEVWSPYYKVHINRIESIQKKFLLFALRNLGWRDRFILPSYKDRLKMLHMNTLEHRRKVGMILFMFKLLNGLIDAPYLRSKLRINESVTIDSDDFFVIAEHRTKYGHYEPVNYMCKVFNDFYKYIDLNVSVSVQRQRLCDLELNNCL